MLTAPLEAAGEGSGKIAALAALSRAGLPIPPAFVVTEQARDLCAEATGGSAPEAPLPDQLLGEIKRHYDELSLDKEMRALSPTALDMIRGGRSQVFVAVRGEGFARLNIRGMPQLQQALREAWRAGCRAVIVQRMVDADRCSILAPHPTADQLRLEASWGLALPTESTPDLFTVHRGDITCAPGRKEWLLTRDPFTEQTAKQRVPPEKVAQQALSEDDVRTLVSLKEQADRLLGETSLEVAFQRNRPWIIQATAIEKPALPPAPEAGTVLAGGEVIVPGFVQGRVSRSPGTAGEGDILVTPTLGPDALTTPVAGVVTERGSIHRLGRMLRVPALRVNPLPSLKDGEEILLDAIGGSIRLLERPSPSRTAAPGRVPSIVTLLASPADPPGDGAVIRAETILLNQPTSPSLLARESPAALTAALQSALESLARKAFPRPVWYRAFDGRSDEVQGLEGADPPEPNPLLGWRGIRRTLEDGVFACEAEALRQLYDRGLHNVTMLLPFVSQPEDLKKALSAIAFPLKVGVMVETPAAALAMDDFCHEGIFCALLNLDALTSLTMGVDSADPRAARSFSELQPAVRKLAGDCIRTCRKYRVPALVQGEACHSPVSLRLLEEWGMTAVVADADDVGQVRQLLETAPPGGQKE